MLSITLSAFLCLIYYLWWSMKKYDSNTPPRHPGSLPILGNAHQFLGSSIRLWDFLKKVSYNSLESGGVSLLQLGPIHRIYVVTDPDDSLTISNTCLDKPFVYDIAKEWAPNGLIAADVSTWKPHRKLLNPMFSQQRMNEYLEIFNNHARCLVERMSVKVTKGKFNTRKYVTAYAQESICEIMLGLRGEKYANMIKDYGEAVEDLLEVFIAKSQKLWLHIPFIFKRSVYKKKLDRSLKKTADIINQILQTKKTELEKNKNELNPILTVPVFEIMLRLQNEQHSLTDIEILEHLEMIIFTGFDSITETLIFGLKTLGSNQRAQQRLYEELQGVLGESRVDISRYDLTQLIYLDAVVKEILRISSSVPFVARQINKDVKLKNYTVPANSIVSISLFGLHRHPVWGSDVEEFRPERWLEPSLPVLDNPNLLSPFSLGKRNCIGKLYAMTSLKTTFAYVVKNYRLLADDSEMVVKYDVAIRSLKGHEISVERR